MKLNEIRDNKGARQKLMRVARGVGSGKGRTGGRGFKGQKSRTGVAINGFEGGQMSVYRRAPKRGFNNIFRLTFAEINLDKIQKAIDAKLLAADKEIDAVALMEAGLIKQVRDGVKLLGTGKWSAKATIRVVGATKSAIAAVEKAGGKVVVEPKKKTVLVKGEKKAPKSEAEKPAKKAAKTTKKTTKKA